MNKKFARKKSLKYDTAFINPCIDKVLEAISYQKNGQKVILVFQKPLTRTDRFQVSGTFPYHFGELFKMAKKTRLLKKMFLLSPHLVQAQKVVYQKNGNLKTFTKIIDLILKKTITEKSDQIHQKVPENLSFLNFNKLQGIVFQEYKINVSRLFIAFLKYFELMGGKILIDKIYPREDIKTVINCKNENTNSFLTNIESPSNFAFVTKIKKNKFRLFENNKFLQIELNSKSENKSKNEIQKNIEKVVKAKIETFQELDTTFSFSTKKLQNILKTIENSLPGTFEKTQLKDNYELSLEKFDIAKQTGITYPEFKLLFHRYGKGIDEMIDEAYEKMNETRDSKKIWNQVENWYQKKYEWLV